MYVIIWEYEVKPAHESEFARVYSEDGEWARLFRKSAGYIGTELLRDEAKKSRYVTIDRWKSKEAFDDFRSNWIKEYDDLDQKCGEWTEKETALGSFREGEVGPI